MSRYLDFLVHKSIRAEEHGPTVNPDDMHPMLFEWQRRIVAWALHVGRAAIWADTGLGKTLMQVEWARQIAGDTLSSSRLLRCVIKPCAKRRRSACAPNMFAINQT